MILLSLALHSSYNWNVINTKCCETKKTVSVWSKKYHSFTGSSSFVFALTLCVRWLSTHVYVTGSCKCVWAPEESGPWPGLPDTGGKAHWVLILKRLVHAHILTHKQADQMHMLLASGSLSVNRCFLPSRPNRTASAPHRRTRYFPTAWPTGQVEGQTHPLVSLWFHFLLYLDPVSIWPTHLSPDKESYNLSIKLDRKLTLPANLKHILNSNV